VNAENEGGRKFDLSSRLCVLCASVVDAPVSGRMGAQGSVARRW
jgi:hypothetical protein